MIAVNLWFIKHSNGLFFYGLDYAEALVPGVRAIWVRNEALARLVESRLPCTPVHVLGFKSLIAAALTSARKRDVLFTPSSHPIAFVPRQTVVVHDSFPFEGGLGRLKRLLFRMGVFASNSTVGYVNHSDSHKFLQQCGIPELKTRYMPNRLGEEISAARSPAIIGERLSVGLFGSDSYKKDYDALFIEANKLPRLQSARWIIFGHDNAYTDRLKKGYPLLDISVENSDSRTMSDFLSLIDIAVSVANGEGFGRPIALSLMSGIPTMLLDTLVFREFYKGSAQLFATVAGLVDALACYESGTVLHRPKLESEAALRADFEDAVSWLATGQLQARDKLPRNQG